MYSVLTMGGGGGGGQVQSCVKKQQPIGKCLLLEDFNCILIVLLVLYFLIGGTKERVDD